MAFISYDSPFHITHDEETASKMAMKMDLSILITNLIKEMELNQTDAAELLGVSQSRISDLANYKIEKFTIDTMFDFLDALGCRPSLDMSSPKEATISIPKTKAA